MLKTKKMGIVILSTIMIVSLASCGNTTPDEWKFSRDDVPSFSSLTSVKEGEGDAIKYSVDVGSPIFSKALDKEGLILFDYDKAYKDGSDNGKDYIDYELMKKYEIKYDNLENNENLSGFTVTLDSKEEGTTIRGMIRKDYNGVVNTFMDIEPYEETPVSPEEEEAQKAKEEQEKYERKYASTEFTWEKGGKFTVEVLSNFGMILAGLAFDTPTASVNAIFNMLMSFGSFFGASGPTTEDVMNKLKVMDAKLNQIILTLQNNHNQLLTEVARTQAKVDKVLLEQYNSEMTSFTTDYLNKIDDFNRNYSVYVQDKFKTTVKENNFDVKVFLYKNSKNEWCTRQLSEWYLHGEDMELTYTIPNFNNALAKLEVDNQVIKEGFVDAMYKDIDAALAKADVPEGLDKANLRYFLFNNIVEQYNKDYFFKNKSEAQDFANLMINTSKRYAGIGSDSIVDTYFSRLKYMYNFGIELKGPMTTYLSRQLYGLDTNVAKAAQYLAYAGLNDDELAAAYKAARTKMTTFNNETLQKLPDNFSFIAERKISGELFGARFEHRFPVKGDHPSYESNSVFVRYYGSGRFTYFTEKVNISDYNFIDNTNIVMIGFRLKLLKGLGLVSSSSFLIDYLGNLKIIPETAMMARRRLFELKEDDEKIDRFATNISYRDMDGSTDGNVSLYCQDNANPKSKYFVLNKWYNYNGKHSGKYWSGRIMESDFVNARNGEIISDKMITAKATYRESHGIWNNDEDWLFSTHAEALGWTKQYARFFGLFVQK